MIIVKSTDYNFQKHRDIAFVATMGNLHHGHLDLIKAAKLQSSFVVVSIFINPLQFNDPNDLNNYPKSIEADLSLLDLSGCDLVFIPDDSILTGIETVQAPNLSNILCGKSRPGHFDGVLTIVNRLFEIVKPSIALFGLKDFQQFTLIKNHAALNFPNLCIKGIETVRDNKGLALSSRNNLLNQDELKLASNIFNELSLIKKNYSSNNLYLLIDKAKNNLIKLGFKVDYLDSLDALSLNEIDSSTSSIIIAIAVYIGEIRLIDNIIINEP